MFRKQFSSPGEDEMGKYKVAMANWTPSSQELFPTGGRPGLLVDARLLARGANYPCVCCIVADGFRIARHPLTIATLNIRITSLTYGVARL